MLLINIQNIQDLKALSSGKSVEALPNLLHSADWEELLHCRLNRVSIWCILFCLYIDEFQSSYLAKYDIVDWQQLQLFKSMKNCSLGNFLGQTLGCKNFGAGATSVCSPRFALGVSHKSFPTVEREQFFHTSPLLLQSPIQTLRGAQSWQQPPPQGVQGRNTPRTGTGTGGRVAATLSSLQSSSYRPCGRLHSAWHDSLLSL